MKSRTKIQSIFDLLTDNLVDLNIKNKLLARKEAVFRIDLNVNFNFTDFERNINKSYYFHDQWRFKHIFSKVFNAQIKDIFLISEPLNDTPDHAHFLNKYFEENICDPDIEELLTFINDECASNDESIYDYFSGRLLDNSSLDASGNFHIKGIEIIGINNNTHNLSYHGSMFTDETGFDYAHSIFCILELTGSKAMLPFFKELLLESYSLLLEDNYKMAYFTAYAAFESFVNITSCMEYNAERLSDKFNMAFNSHPTIQNFSSYDSYRQLIDNINEYTKIRNIIAHGRSVEDIYYDFDMEKTAKEMYIYTSICILCYEQGIKNFNELRKLFKKNHP